jgi:hypothetical protein
MCNDPKRNASGSFVVKNDALGYGSVPLSVASAVINPALRKPFGNRNSGWEEFQVQTGKNAEIILKQKRTEKGKVYYVDYDAPDNSGELISFIAGMKAVALFNELSRYAENRTEHVERVSRQVAMMCFPAFLAEVGENHDFLTKSCKRT